MPTISPSRMPSKRKLAMRAGKAVARSPRGRAYAARAGKAVARSPRGRRMVWHMAKRRSHKPLAIAGGTLAVIAALLLATRGRDKHKTEAS